MKKCLQLLQNNKIIEMQKEKNTPIIQMLTKEEEMLVSLISNIIVDKTLKEIYAKKRDKVSEIQQ